jgi:hypothetical protein
MDYNELHKYFFNEAYDEKGKKKTLDEDDRESVISFFAESPNPTDAEFHGWAESEGIDVHVAEELAYEFAHKYARFLQGGMWNQQGQPKVDEKQLAEGIQVEYEHTPDEDVARRIALDHLAEIDDYYTRLDKIEKEANKRNQNKTETDEQEYEDE